MSEIRFTPIESVGRGALIRQISELFPRQQKHLITAIGDDAAVLTSSDNNYPLISSEIYSEGVDFDLVYTPLKHLGFKLVSLAVSDILAMNGKPEMVLINLALTSKYSVEMIAEFYSGVKRACDKYDISLAGGDLAAASQTASVSITAFGKAKVPVYRSGANEGDAICVTGDLGAASCGLMILLREKRHFESSGEVVMNPELDMFEYVIQKQLMPSARLDCIQAFADSGVLPTAMADLTKSFSTTLSELMEASHLGCKVFEAAIPVSPDTRFAADELEKDIDEFILYGGEDAELLFTLSEKDVEKFSDIFRDFVVIGKVESRDFGVKLQTAEGHLMTLK
ncbi:MAG: thiamine-phosphate kinase [Balneolales bacterium]|nr:thiamine-phosphate kinase [Balneolales bacterium]